MSGLAFALHHKNNRILMNNPLSQVFVTKQFLVFLLTGGTAALINFFSRIVYSQWLDFSSAIVLAYITGMVPAFFLAKVFVFKKGGQNFFYSILFFSIVNLAGITQTWLISIVLAHYALPVLGIDFYVKELAHGAGIMVPAFTSYLGHKHFSFR